MKTLATLAILATALLIAGVSAQEMTHDMGAPAGSQTHKMPTLLGQDAFGTAQEIVHILEDAPNTDWSKVNMDRLREHLIDMDEVALRANAAVTALPDGIKVHVSGNGRTLEAVQRLIPTQTKELNQLGKWRLATDLVSDGVILTVEATDPKEVLKIKGLGYFGVITSGSYHQMHHLMMATGQHL
jgi:hypothetical protein